MSLSVGGCLPVLSPVLGGSVSTVFIVRLLVSWATALAVCLCLITYCKNLALDSRLTETIVPGAIISVKRKYFHWWPIFSFNDIHVRQILHTKMVNVQYSSCFELCEGSAKQDSRFETLQVKCWPLDFVYEMLCRVSWPCLGAMVYKERQLCWSSSALPSAGHLKTVHSRLLSSLQTEAPAEAIASHSPKGSAQVHAIMEIPCYKPST